MHAWLAPHEREEGPVSPAMTPVVHVQLALEQVQVFQFGNRFRNLSMNFPDAKFIDTV
jgi:hypothetical protein